MPCFVLDQISVIQMAWLVDINQIQDLISIGYIDYMLVYRCEDLILIGHIDSDFQSAFDFKKSTSGCLFTLGGGAISWRSVKQSCIANSTMEAEYVAACEAAKEVVWHKKFLFDLGVVRME